MIPEQIDSLPHDSPTVPRSPAPTLARALERNIDALIKRRADEERESTLEEHAADAITRFAGSMLFVYIHLALFGFWILVNVGWLPVLPAWDSSLVILAMIASVEAIFLSTFVLISQNRMSKEADKRADLDLHISLLAEHELTKLAELVVQIAEKLHIEADSEVEDVKQDVAPGAVLDEIEKANP
jgi:uncharacterized membrane protein